MKQTAVEWLIEQIESGKIEIVYSNKIHSIKCLPEITAQAKELENQQKQNYLKEYFEWHNSMWFASHTPEDIIEFNETYGGDKQECQFEPDSNLTSATKCKWCGLEKWQHKTYEGEQ